MLSNLAVYIVSILILWILKEGPLPVISCLTVSPHQTRDNHESYSYWTYTPTYLSTWECIPVRSCDQYMFRCFLLVVYGISPVIHGLRTLPTLDTLETKSIKQLAA